MAGGQAEASIMPEEYMRPPPYTMLCIMDLQSRSALLHTWWFNVASPLSWKERILCEQSHTSPFKQWSHLYVPKITCIDNSFVACKVAIGSLRQSYGSQKRISLLQQSRVCEGFSYRNFKAIQQEPKTDPTTRRSQKWVTWKSEHTNGSFHLAGCRLIYWCPRSIK